MMKSRSNSLLTVAKEINTYDSDLSTITAARIDPQYYRVAIADD